MSDYGFAHQGQIYTPNGSDVPAESNADRNKAIEAAELAYWATGPDRFAPAYFAFPAENLPLFGRPRVYRESFRPCLYTFVNVAGPYDLHIHNGRDHVATVSTWLGTPLGTIISAKVYRHNFGSRMVAITVKGTNGASYYGRASWDHGQVIRLRKVKG